ncbi:MAG: hypothetical protein MUF18_17670 [Fimbriiglobus sp.]|nr:hypothetical protein [Fimbriiglobus sp.]
MRRLVIVLTLPLLTFAVGCSNRPIVGLMDCFFPSKVNPRSIDPPRPTDSDPLPPPVFDSGLRSPPDNFRRDDLPLDLGPRRGGDSTLPPLGAPVPADGPLRRENSPWTPDPGSRALPLPGGGR